MNDTYMFLTIVNTVIVLAAAVGSIFAFFRASKSELMGIQEKTVLALQQQVSAIQQKLDNLEKENQRLLQIIETIQLALKGRGIHVTIDGDIVTISDTSGSASTLKKRPANKAMTKLTEPTED